MAKVADKLHNIAWAGYCFVRMLLPDAGALCAPVPNGIE
jgi:hypothetical protein